VGEWVSEWPKSSKHVVHGPFFRFPFSQFLLWEGSVVSWSRAPSSLFPLSAFDVSAFEKSVVRCR